MKLLWIDTETTGLDPDRHGIISMAIIVEIDGKVLLEREFRMNPRKEIDATALVINGFDVEEIETFEPSAKVKQDIANVFSCYVNKSDPSDSFTPAGYNVRFDYDMLNSLWKSCGDFGLSHWVSRRALDVMSVYQYAVYTKALPELPKYSLTDVASSLGIDTENAHDAMADIRMTRAVAQRLNTVDLLHGSELQNRLNRGRDYLMSTATLNINDALDAFGFDQMGYEK